MNTINRLINRYRHDGYYGVCQAIERRLFPNRIPHTQPVWIALDEVCKNHGFTVVQIGAYIGNTENDPLFKTVSRRLGEIPGQLICVEPVKEYYTRLVENYRDVPNVYCENVAISDRAGLSSFFRLGVDPVQYGYPEWLCQLGSLKEERMLELWDKYERDGKLQRFYLQHRVEEQVTCITLSDLTRKYQLQRIDLLQIDAEGYELEILNSIDFSAIPIRFVNYESVLLHKHKRRADQLMRRQGYCLVDYGQDTLAYKKKDSPLTRRWCL